ncbi:hypothetical protein AS579_14765 [Acinetobacter baumannii]|nr:hypothetical protein AS579_14765 [Acinetobacter baumannii]PCN90615.1 hypothetical protein AS583_16240 [Acinetobacter baumannii]PCN91064.1 hypothetical protein AS582_13145 [Acinetobacter baumannii]
MGISAGGLAVPFNGTMENAIELVSGWKNRTINVVSLSERTDFDTRYDNCISLKIFNNVLIIYHADFLFSASVHDKFHRTLILSGFCLLKIAKISLNSSFFPKPIKR